MCAVTSVLSAEEESRFWIYKKLRFRTISNIRVSGLTTNNNLDNKITFTSSGTLNFLGLPPIPPTEM